MADENTTTPAQSTNETGEGDKGTEKPESTETGEASKPTGEEQVQGKPEDKGTKPAEEKSPVPEEYALALPEGSKMDATALAGFKDFAKANNLTNDQAQAILQDRHDVLAERDAKIEADFKEEAKAWTEEVKNDPEFGGEAYEANVAMGNRIIEKYGDQSLIDELDLAGLGNHPGLTRMLIRLGRAMSNDEFIKTGQKTQAPRTATEKLYGDSTEKKE